MTERDDFDKIVEGLELDLSFIDETPARPTRSPSRPGPRARMTTSTLPTTRSRSTARSSRPPLVPRRRSVLLAWIGVLGAPLSLVVATLSGVLLDRPIIAAASLIFVGAAIYLILQLPEHGPSRKDWPDDGAVL